MVEDWLTGKPIVFSIVGNPVWNEQKQIISGIYKIVNKINNKVYIGQSVDVCKRLRTHYTTYNKKDSKQPIYKAMREYGIDNFTVELLVVCDSESLDDFEVYYVDKFNAYRDGYNQTPGGDFNPSKLEEIVERRTKVLLYDEEVNAKLRHIGNANPRAILTEEQVISMRQRYDSGETTKEIYKDFTYIKYNTFETALYGMSWKHLPNITKRKQKHSLTKDEVYHIRCDYMEGLTIKELAKKYQAQYEQIRRIIKLERWLKPETIPEGYQK